MLSKLLLTIDSQNVSHKHFDTIISHIYNNVGSRIINGYSYMDLLRVNNGWIETSIHHGIDPLGIYCHPGKDSVDHYLVGDVFQKIIQNQNYMNYDGWILISNDSDFRRLCLDCKPYVNTILYCRSHSPKDLTNVFDQVYYYDTLENIVPNKKRKLE